MLDYGSSSRAFNSTPTSRRRRPVSLSLSLSLFLSLFLSMSQYLDLSSCLSLPCLPYRSLWVSPLQLLWYITASLFQWARLSRSSGKCSYACSSSNSHRLIQCCCSHKERFGGNKCNRVTRIENAVLKRATSTPKPLVSQWELLLLVSLWAAVSKGASKFKLKVVRLTSRNVPRRER